MPRPGSRLEARATTLTPRQMEVMRLLVKGRTNGEIAHELGITLDGAKYHVTEILGRLSVTSREEAVSRWLEATGPPSHLRRGLRIIAGAAALKAGAAVVAAVAVTGLVAAVIRIDESPEPPADPTLDGAGATVRATSTPAPSATPGRAPTSVPTPNRPKGPPVVWRWEWPEPSANLFLTADEDAVVVSGSGAALGQVGEYRPAPGRIVLLDARTGAERWAFETPARGYPALLTASLVVAGTADGTLYALDHATGAEKWRMGFPGIPYAVLDSGDTLLIAPSRAGSWTPQPLFDPDRSFESMVWAVDASTGSFLWEEPNPALDDGTLLGAAAAGITIVERMSAVRGIARRDASTGSDIWETPTPALAVPPVVAHGLVWLAGTEGEVLALDAASGLVRWVATSIDGRPYSSALVTPYGVAFTGPGAVDTWAPDGALQWREEFGECPDADAHHRYAGESGGLLLVESCGMALLTLPRAGADFWMAPQGGVPSAVALSDRVVFSTSIGGESPTYVMALGAP